jgi:hypothetical protein
MVILNQRAELGYQDANGFLPLGGNGVMYIRLGRGDAAKLGEFDVCIGFVKRSMLYL